MLLNTDHASPADQRAGRMTEIVAALIALIIIGSLLLLLWKSFQYIGGDEKANAAFQQVKDLLLFTNALVGVVIGYYFTKVNTENRAKSAEATARDATAAVRQAVVARDEAETNSSKLRTALADILPAAEQLLAQIPEPSSSEAESEGMDEHVVAAYFNLQDAVQRARHAIR
jgi:hypothetical protein